MPSVLSVDRIFSVDNLSKILLFSTGTFAGMSLGISLISVPSILASKDPLPSWRILYKNGSKMAVSSILLTSVTGLTCFLIKNMKMKHVGYALSADLAFVIIPFTIFGMGETNKELFKISENDDTRVRELIKKWATLQWVRTIFSVSAFGVAIFTVMNRS